MLKWGTGLMLGRGRGTAGQHSPGAGTLGWAPGLYPEISAGIQVESL